MRRLAAKEHLVSPAMAGFLGKLASRTDSSVDQEGYVTAPEEMAVAAQVEDAAARAVEGMGRVAGRLRRGAAAAVMKGNEEALVDALLRQAVVADAARATIETFAAAVRRFLAAAAGGGSGGGTADGCPRGRASAGATHKAFSIAHIYLLVAPAVP